MNEVGDGFAEFFQALVILSFPMVVGVVFIAILARLFKADTDFLPLVGHGIVFGLLGMIVGLLFVFGGPNSISAFLPHFIIGAGFLFQLMGRLNKNWDVPVESVPSIAGAATGAFCFLFAVLYFGGMDISRDYRAITGEAGVVSNRPASPTEIEKEPPANAEDLNSLVK